MSETLTISPKENLTAIAPEKISPSSAPNPFAHKDKFVHRHIGPSADETVAMLEQLGFSSLDTFIDKVVPPQIRSEKPLQLSAPQSEFEALKQLREIASQNKIFRSFIGMGYSDCITPPVIQRNILENPGWYTQYTPYQAEISQGRLEALLNFQTMISDLTGMEIANASLLDEATACAEAMLMCHALKGTPERNLFIVSKDCHPQNIEVIQTRAKALGIEVAIGHGEHAPINEKVFGYLVQYPGTDGSILDPSFYFDLAHKSGAMTVVACDLLALTLIKPPGEFGADIAVGSAQRFGVPLGYGGPHAAFFATREIYKRSMPGRLIGVSKDSSGKPALRLSLQTREQHIRREKATSNICTAQALLANMASMYAVYHGPEGLRKIAERIHGLMNLFTAGLRELSMNKSHGGHGGMGRGDETYFDTIVLNSGTKKANDFHEAAAKNNFNLRIIDEHRVGISFDESTTVEDVELLLRIIHDDKPLSFTMEQITKSPWYETLTIPEHLRRTSKFLEHPVFNKFHSETEMLRYIKRLENKDLSLTVSMIPLGSCTMKLNATAEMFPVSWPEFSKIHPFAPLSQARGYQIIFQQLEQWLAEITGFAGISLQPNAGSQGEYAGLLVIQKFHENRGESHRKICLIPTSAHGTNPASAIMAGMEVVAVACDTNGNIDVNDLRAKAATHKNNLAALMVTYPSTHGVFEESIREVCKIIHEHGGQVYMDGANMNAQVGLCSPGNIGADVCHLNLHKTFCIPHGGGGPGMGPIGVAEHLVEFLPGHSVVNLGGENPIGAVAAAPWGSASILTISWVYISLMGGAGLTEATKMAILNANYMAHRLNKFFPVLYKGKGNFVAHEC
ncbi:MAG: aminomethyl-transferring glycine dehydrogenase, partial [Verrucomicrobiota bacterium]|nr:aminomethyl-transferring glycine dehydrogenase [Verrucomicrobiota bacterium]